MKSDGLVMDDVTGCGLETVEYGINQVSLLFKKVSLKRMGSYG